ncbi:hypothetical protein DSO57_1032440 [Entomophthora muscae]|uniref:Uncharacterized protein n=1 Tax=Entomophthora muscae TaxID=34485 RepID=A0ACC2S2F5_9FUNG|nr:hypothetical protein DSO57_1032440 [Entomophthora muscae]
MERAIDCGCEGSDCKGRQITKCDDQIQTRAPPVKQKRGKPRKPAGGINPCLNHQGGWELTLKREIGLNLINSTERKQTTRASVRDSFPDYLNFIGNFDKNISSNQHINKEMESSFLNNEFIGFQTLNPKERPRFHLHHHLRKAFIVKIYPTPCYSFFSDKHIFEAMRGILFLSWFLAYFLPVVLALEIPTPTSDWYNSSPDDAHQKEFLANGWFKYPSGH